MKDICDTGHPLTGWVMSLAGKQPYSFVGLQEKDFY